MSLNTRTTIAKDTKSTMSVAREIPIRGSQTQHRKMSVSSSFDPALSLSTSPAALRSQSFGTQTAASAAKQLKPFQTQDIKVLLLENVNKIGQTMLKAQGYQVEALKSSLPEDQLIEKIK